MFIKLCYVFALSSLVQSAPTCLKQRKCMVREVQQPAPAPMPSSQPTFSKLDFVTKSVNTESSPAAAQNTSAPNSAPKVDAPLVSNAPVISQNAAAQNVLPQVDVPVLGDSSYPPTIGDNDATIAFSGRVFYVSPTGSDMADGLSTGGAWKTLARAVRDKLQPGDRLLLKGGATFNEGLSLNAWRGTASSPIQISTYGTGRATLKPAKGAAVNGYNCGGLEIRNIIAVGVTKVDVGFSFYSDIGGLSHLHITNFEASNFDSGVVIQSYAASYKDVRLSNCLVHDNQNTGMYFGTGNRGDLAQVHVDHCEIWNHPGERGYGLYLWGVNGALVERSVSHDNGDHGGASQGFAVQEADSVTFRHCEAYNIKTIKGDGNGFIIDGGSTHCTIEYCYSHDNQGSGYQWTSYDNAGAQFVGHQIRFNLAINNGVGISSYGQSAQWAVSDSQIFGNTIYADSSKTRSTAGQIYLLTNPGNKVGIYNNIVSVVGATAVEAWISVEQSSITFAGNAYYANGAPMQFNLNGRSQSTLEAWRASTGWEKLNGVATGTIANPLFQSGTNAPIVGLAQIDRMEQVLSGWQLQSTSTLVDAGVDLSKLGFAVPKLDLFGNMTPQGAKPDVGAGEKR